MLGPLILVHELGHFWAARAFNIRVEEFGIGYPPRMIKLFERKKTIFSLNWIPLGGFNKLSGEDNPEIEGGFASAPKIARFVVLIAGATMNILLAFLLFLVMFILGAPEYSPGALISDVLLETPASAAGLQADDVIIEIDGHVIGDYSEAITYIQDNLGVELSVIYIRDGIRFETDMTPRTTWPENQGPTGIVIQSNYRIVQYGLLESTRLAGMEIWRIMKSMVEIPAMAIRGEIDPRLLRPVSIVGISQLGGEALEASINESFTWPIINLMAFISVALGITNLLPLPALDGGRIFFILIEAIRGKRVEPNHEALVHFIGFMLLMALMVITVYFDIVDPII